MALSEENFFEKKLVSSDRIHLFYNERLAVFKEHLQIPSELLEIEEDCFLFPSSGTSATFKWVLHTESTLRASARGVCQFLQIDEKDIQLIVLPTFHVGAFAQWVRSSETDCKSYEWKGRWCPTQFVELVEQNAVTLSSLVPTQVYDLCQRELRAPRTLRAIMVGGAALDEKLYFEARKLGWPLLPSYGMSEAASTVACASLESLSSEELFPELELLQHWANSSRGRNCSRLKLKGPALTRGFLSFDPQAQEIRFEKIAHGSFYKSGDVVEFFDRGDGRCVLSFVERSDKRVKVLGEWVNLNLIENKIQQEMDSLKIPRFTWELLAEKSERRGVRLVLLLEESKSAEFFDSSALESVNKRLNSLELIKELRVVKKIPRTELGKFLPMSGTESDPKV